MICPNCKQPVEVPAPVLERMGYKKEGKIPVFYKGKGCKHCKGLGYSGRLGIYEILEINQDIQDLIIKRATSEQIKQQAVKNGMHTLRDAGLEKAKEGLTTVEEVLRVTAKV